MPETNLLVTCLNLLIQQFKLPSSGIGKDFSGHISEHKNRYCLFFLFLQQSHQIRGLFFLSQELAHLLRHRNPKKSREQNIGLKKETTSHNRIHSFSPEKRLNLIFVLNTCLGYVKGTSWSDHIIILDRLFYQ